MSWENPDPGEPDGAVGLLVGAILGMLFATAFWLSVWHNLGIR